MLRHRPTRPSLPLLSILLVPVLLFGVAGAEANDTAETARRMKQMQRQRLLDKMAQKRASAIERLRIVREASKAGWRDGRAPAGQSRKRSRDDLEPGGPQGSTPRLHEVQGNRPVRAFGFTPPANVRVNSPIGDVPSDGQAEQDVGAHGDNILVAWNDGRGFSDFTDDTQGWGYSTNGGVSFTDGGKLPKPAGSPLFIWTSDPLVAVNEKTGEFWYLGLCYPTSTTNGIGIVRGTFSGGTFNWDPPVIVRSGSNFSVFYDKPWLVADSLSGNLYVSYTEFFPGGDEINFTRSTDGGATWSADLKVSKVADDGWVQGSRPLVAPNGNVSVFWYQIGESDEDTMLVRRSTNGGTSFGPEVGAATFFANFGTGAPGFNRDLGIQFPSVAVDRFPGSSNFGRLYLTWNESVNFYNDTLSIANPVNESEPNDTGPQADPIVIGRPVFGNIVGLDTDWFSFSATQGTTYIFWCDSLTTSLDYTMRVLCSDQITLLALSGALSFTGSTGLIVWTAPSTATYYLRMASLTSSENGFYRIRTQTNFVGDPREQARDHRDVFVASSGDGGTTWTTPVRVNQDPGYFDNWLPEIEVGFGAGEGVPHLISYDWRDGAAGCGGLSHVYLANSYDAGATWNELGAITNVQTDWSATSSNIAPNQGDYLALFANSVNLYASWADGRNGDPDVYMSVIPLSSTPVLVSLASASATAERVSLSWYAAGEGLTSASVERRTESSAWQSLGSILPDGSGRLTFEDTDVAPGSRYGYRLLLREGASERHAGEVWVDVPDAARFAISGIRPNPSTGDAWCAFSLPGDGPARLTILDVAGRAVRDVQLGALGAGNHRVNLAAQGRLPAGVYLVRLTYGDASRTARWSIVQ